MFDIGCSMNKALILYLINQQSAILSHDSILKRGLVLECPMNYIFPSLISVCILLVKKKKNSIVFGYVCHYKKLFTTMIEIQTLFQNLIIYFNGGLGCISFLESLCCHYWDSTII